MDTVISLIVLSILSQLVVPQFVFETSFRAEVELVSGESRIFSGETVQLKCSVPNPRRSTWSFLWFRGSEKLSQTGEKLTLWRANIKHSGKYYCRGVRDSVVGNIHTLPSLPLEIHVDGGFAILQVPPGRAIDGGSLNVTCRVRGEPPLHEVILYKDGLEVMRQKGPHLYLTDLSREDQGMYSCRASWNMDRRTRSVISSDTLVEVVEVLSEPLLEIVTHNELIPGDKIKLICHCQYNGPAPAPSLHYYFYKNDERLAPTMSENHILVRKLPGRFGCRVKVPVSGLSRWSETKTFGVVTEPPTMLPPFLQPRDPWHVVPTISSPDLSLPPLAEPTANRVPSHPSTAGPTPKQPTDLSNQSSDPLLMPSTPAGNPVLSTVQPLKETTTLGPVDTAEASGDMFGVSGDMSGESGDFESGDLSDDDYPDSIIW